MALALARKIGPASGEALAAPRASRSLELRLLRGQPPSDAVVAVLARRARRDAVVAGELLRDVMEELALFGSSLIPPLMRRLHDPDDLVVSVLGDCFQELFTQRVEGRTQLVAQLRQRMRWKSLDRSRELLSQKRREDLRVEALPLSRDAWSQGPSPVEQAAAREGLQRLVRRVRALSGQDRTILELHLRHLTPPRIAAEMGVSPGIVRRALRRMLDEEEGAA